jgi:catechol-2,3-dioxygenase
METIIAGLISHFEKGSLSRRDLVQALTILAASRTAVGAAAAAQEELNFKAANIDHVSIHVADLKRSVQLYQNMFGFTVVSQDQAQGGAMPLQGDYAGFHIKDPDGVNVQISQR